MHDPTFKLQKKSCAILYFSIPKGGFQLGPYNAMDCFANFLRME